MMNSGTDAAAVESMNANAVPTGSPLFMSSPVMVMTDVTFAYVGMPITTARGTVHHCSPPRCDAMKPSGTKPCNPARRKPMTNIIVASSTKILDVSSMLLFSWFAK